jgi:molybdopterin-guanine dinucleotide biosynthesis protein A
MNRKTSRVVTGAYAVESFLEAGTSSYGGSVFPGRAMARASRVPTECMIADMENALAPDVSAFILAGGKSTRMGTNKAFVEFDGRTLLARALDLARSVTADVRIVGRRDKFAAHAPVVEDAFHDCGPLAGIQAALRASSSQLNLILAVDMPFVSREFLQYLIDQARNAPEADVVVPLADGRRQPLCAVYRVAFAALAENSLRVEQYRIDRLFDQVRTRVIGSDELAGAGFSSAIFSNLNTPEELEAQKRGA